MAQEELQQNEEQEDEEQPEPQFGQAAGQRQPSQQALNYRARKEELNRVFNEWQKALGVLNKLRGASALATAAVNFAIAALGLGGLTTALIVIGIVIPLLGIAAFLIYWNQPSTKARQGSYGTQPFNSLNSTDQGNLIKVEAAAGLISTLQEDLIKSRGIDQEIAAATAAINKANISDEMKKKFKDLLGRMQELARKIRSSEGSKDNLLQELHTAGLEYEFLTADNFLPGKTRRLHVPWRTQPPKSTTCNYYAAEMAVLATAYDRSSANPKTYPRELERKLLPGVDEPHNSCPVGTDRYMRWAAGKAGLGTIKVEKRNLSGKQNGKTGPSESEWQQIKDLVVNKKTPVVIGTNFSGKGSHFLTIVGFSEDGREAYVNDPASKTARMVANPNQLRANIHLINDQRWYGGKYPYYAFLISS